jgi:hypothetical protein
VVSENRRSKGEQPMIANMTRFGAVGDADVDPNPNEQSLSSTDSSGFKVIQNVGNYAMRPSPFLSPTPARLATAVMLFTG